MLTINCFIRPANWTSEKSHALFKQYGVTKDPDKAIYCLTRAAETEHVKAFYKLGLFYKQQGAKNAQFMQKAEHYFRLAGSHDHEMVKQQPASLTPSSSDKQ